MSSDAVAMVSSCIVTAATAQSMRDVHLQFPSSTSERTSFDNVRVDPGCILEYNLQCSLTLCIDSVDIKFKRSKCHECTGTADDCLCPPSPRACTACCDVACSDIPDYTLHIDSLINDSASIFHSSVHLSDDKGNPDGDNRRLTDDEYCACPTSIGLDDNFCDATHLASEWAELLYSMSGSDCDLPMLFCEMSSRTRTPHCTSLLHLLAATRRNPLCSDLPSSLLVAPWVAIASAPTCLWKNTLDDGNFVHLCMAMLDIEPDAANTHTLRV
uniref:Uncharacterized protein n=1 Tax=Physcomitrium patens TaxID=3218 RepID=A0A2K1JSW2_PHYPA|nr:hypothetical protein PHYPA_014397 [Physcomitrium patens]